MLNHRIRKEPRVPTITVLQQPTLKPEQIAPHLNALWQKFLEQKEEINCFQHYDAFLEHVVTTCTTKMELGLLLGLRKTIADIPRLLADYAEDNDLPADQVIAGTNKKLKWQCASCGCHWKATGNDRVSGTGCPACSNHVVKPDRSNSLLHSYPNLAREYAEDNELPSDQIVASTLKPLKWKCFVCRHKWLAPGSVRIRGHGCPACSGRVASPQHNLTVTHPHLTVEYSPHNDTPANLVLAGSPKKYDWICGVCSHEWKASAVRRSHGGGCPACAKHRKIATRANNLTITNPNLCEEYSTKNKIPAYDLVAGSNKKVLWECKKCHHEWETMVCTRTMGSRCPRCVRLRVPYEKSLIVTHPHLATEYHRDNRISACEIRAGTGEKVLWQCSVTHCRHIWYATGDNRVRGRGCPRCAKRHRSETRRRNKTITM